VALKTSLTANAQLGGLSRPRCRTRGSRCHPRWPLCAGRRAHWRRTPRRVRLGVA